MTEIGEINVTPAQWDFVLQWGDLGSKWGMNRSIAQIQALLFLSTRPVNAEEICETLGIARSNVSNSLKELIGWKLIRQVPVRGDRREHFVAETDPWEIAMRIAEGRKSREIDPALEAVATCLAQARSETEEDVQRLERLQNMDAFLRNADRWYAQMLQVPRPKLEALMKMGSRVISLLSRPVS